MSVKIMANVWEMPELNASEKLLLLAIADHCDDQGSCYPSAERLQRKCGWSTGTYTKYINILRHAGFIKKTPRASTKDGRQNDITQIIHSSLYTGKEFDRLRDARKIYSRSNPMFLHVQRQLKYQQLKSPSLYTGKDKPLGLCQEEKNGCTDFDLQSECDSIMNELDAEEDPPQSIGLVKRGSK